MDCSVAGCFFGGGASVRCLQEKMMREVLVLQLLEQFGRFVDKEGMQKSPEQGVD